MRNDGGRWKRLKDEQRVGRGERARERGIDRERGWESQREREGWREKGRNKGIKRETEKVSEREIERVTESDGEKEQ